MVNNEDKLRKGTVCFITNAGKVLLALIEYGPNDRKWNGIGGFTEEGESLKDAVVREAKEETHIALDKDSLIKVAELNISPVFQLNVFLTNNWHGELKIKDLTLKELKWFPENELPFSKMHEGNDKWLPKILKGKLIKIDNGRMQEILEFPNE